MFKSVGSLIKSLPLRSKTPQTILALQVRQVAGEVLKVTCADLPVEIVESIRVVSYKNGVLFMRAQSLVLSELQMRSEGLIKDINKAVGKQIISKIRFKVS